MNLKNKQETPICPMCMRRMDITEERIKQLEEELKVICELRNKLIDKNKQLESDIKEYKDIINSLKQKIDVSECLYEDSKKEIKQLRKNYKNQHNHWTKIMNEKDDEIEELLLEIKGLIGQHDSSDQ